MAGNQFVLNIESAEIVLMDLHTRLSDYSQKDIDYLIVNRKPVVIFDEWDRGNMSKDEYPNPLTEQQRQVFNFINIGRIKAVHFCRLLDKTKKYAPNIYPYEKAISYEEPMLSADQLFNREYDIVFIANHSPSREAIAKAIQEDGRVKYKISIGEKKIPFNEFVDEHRKGKLFISSGAGGYSNERPQCLFSIAGMIQENTDQLLLHEYTDLENCIKIESPPTQKDLDKIFEIINNKDYLYKIYLNGFNFIKTYYTKEYIATDILNKIIKHLA